MITVNIFNFNETNKNCDENCVFRQIVPDICMGVHTGYFKLRCILFDILPLYKKCVVSYDDYLEYYRMFSVIDGELKEKRELRII